MESTESINISDVPLVILAGGRATRLGALSQAIPKFLMPIEEGKTFADFQLTWAHRQGFRRIFLSIGYQGYKIRDYCGDGKRWELSIEYFEDGTEPLGTGGAVANLKKADFNLLALTYGDTLLSLDAKKILARYLEAKPTREALMTIFKLNIEGHRPNATWAADQRGVHYSKGQPDARWQFIDYGFLILSRRFVEGLSSFGEKAFDLALGLEQASQRNELAGFEVKERFWEIGSPEALDAFRNYFKGHV